MSLLDFVRGEARFTVVMDSPERAVNLLHRSIAVRKIKMEGNKLEFCCNFSSCDTAERIICECAGKIEKKKCIGILYFLSKYKKRTGLFVGLASALMCIFLSTFFIWDIRIEGNESVPDREVIEQLEKIGFKPGLIKKRVNTESIVNFLLINEERLSWAAINFDGTVAHVEVREAKIGRLVPKKKNVNLVASSNGIIIRVDALDGSAAVAKGDTVLRGQLLVSAFVEKRTGGSLLRGARGYVWAKTQHGYVVEVPLEYCEKRLTGKENKKIQISILGKKFDLSYLNKQNYGMADCRVYDGKLRINEKIYLPVDIKLENVREYEIYTKRRSEKQALEEASNIAKARLSTEYPHFTTAEINEDYIVKDGKLIYTCNFSGVENIAEPLEFELS